MRLTALENTPVDYTAHVKDDFLNAHGLKKGNFQGISKELKEKLESCVKFEKSPGGSAANVCHGFANLGMESAFIGSIGNDENGRYYKEELRKAGVIPYLEEKRGSTGVCMAFITPDKERTFGVNMGKSSSLSRWGFESWPLAITDIFHTTAYALDSMYPAVRRAIKIAKKNGAKISFDLASTNSIQRHRSKIEYLLENYIDILFANEEEAEALTKMGAYAAAVELGKKHTVVIKLGKQGAVLRDPLGRAGESIQSYFIPAYKVKVANTNGAGDAFAAGFLYGFAHGYDLEMSGKIGAFYASRVVGEESARLPYRIDNIERLI